MSMRKMIAVAAIATSTAIPMAANAVTIVTQTINNVEWRFQLNPADGTATLGLGATSTTDEARWACPKVAVDAAEIPWTFTGDDGISYRVTAIADRAFQLHTDLSGILTIPPAVKHVGPSAFQKIGNALTGFAGGNCVTNWGNYAFEDNKMMVGTYPDMTWLAKIGESPFKNASALTGRLNLGNSITTLPQLAFANSQYSGTAVLPASITTIGQNSNNGVFESNPNLEAIWVKGKPDAASQTYTTVYCAKLAASCPSMKMILMGKNTKGARMTQAGGNAMLYGATGVQVFVPTNGYWNGLVAGGTNNKVWYYGPTGELDLEINHEWMQATITPTTVNALTNALAWVPQFKTHFNLDARISVTNAIDLTDVTIDSTAVSGVTFDRLMFSAKTQAQLNAILDAFPATTPVSIDPTGLTENMVIPETYNNVHVKTVPGVTIKRTARGFMLIVK